MKREIKQYIEKLLIPEGGDILLSCGDVGHYFEQNKEYYTQMLEHYTHIFVVPGNHDLYLVNSSQKHKYDYTSENRLIEMRDWCNTQSNIHFMEGQVISIDGLKIGGYGNWYDLPYDDDIELWKNVMNDSNLIMTEKEPYKISYGYGGQIKHTTFDTQAYRKVNEGYLDNIVKEKCDILMCHIIPSLIPDHLKFSGHVGEDANIFYETDDLDKVKQTEAEIVVYGHNHENKEWELDGIEFKTNAVAYPNEYGFKGIQHFTFVKE